MRKTNNHFKPIDELQSGDDNEFLLSPDRLVSHNQKDQLIDKLQRKNQKLIHQIARIDGVLNATPEKTRYGTKMPQVRHDTANKQLQNAYKQIKTYEYEVKKLRDGKESGSYVVQIKKVEILLKQKEELSSKLKKELAEVKKQSKQIVKKLKNDNKKQYYENRSAMLSTEIKFLREKIKELENRKQMHLNNFEKQTLFIKKLERQLLKNGMDNGALQALKDKFSIPDKSSTYYGTQYGTNKMGHTTRILNEKQFVEDRTPQAYKYLHSQLKLLQKMEKDYQAQMSNAEQDKDSTSLINLRSRNKLLQIEDEIERIQARIEEMKKMIDPRNLKPQRAISMQKAAGVGRYGDVNKSLSSIKSPFSALYKTEELGKASRNGRKFADRIKLGKNPAKIVAIDFYQNKEGICNVVGMQTTYEVNGDLKKSAINMIHEPKKASKKSFTLFDNDDYFKQIECVFNEKGLIIGVGIVSLKGIAGRVGPSDGARRPMNISKSEYPASLYGSFNSQGLELMGCEILEQKK